LAAGTSKALKLMGAWGGWNNDGQTIAIFRKHAFIAGKTVQWTQQQGHWQGAMG